MAKVNAAVAGIMIALSIGELIPTAASLSSLQVCSFSVLHEVSMYLYIFVFNTQLFRPLQEVLFSNILGQAVMFGSLELMRRAGMH